MNAYFHVLRQRPLGLLLLAAVLARLPMTMNGLALVLFVEGETGSYGDAGAVAGGVALGMGVAAPFLGRVADRRGPRVMLPVAFAHAALLLAIVALGGDAPVVVLVVLAALAGAAFPPATPVVRARMPVMLADRRELLGPSYALDAVLVELTFVGGPLLTAVVITATSAAVALVISAVAAVAGTVVVLALLPALERPARSRDGGLLGPLRSPAILTLTATMLPFGLAIGCLEVTIPAFSEAEGAAEMAGVLLALWAAGSAVGGIVYGVRDWSLSVASRHLRLSALYPLAFVPALAATSIGWMALLILPAGILIAPIFASRNELVAAAAPAGTETEALTWPLTTLLCGSSAGAAIAGALVEEADWRAGVVAGLVAAAAGAALAVARRRTLATAETPEIAVPVTQGV